VWARLLPSALALLNTPAVPAAGAEDANVGPIDVARFTSWLLRQSDDHQAAIDGLLLSVNAGQQHKLLRECIVKYAKYAGIDLDVDVDFLAWWQSLK
jgi:hypothetical protein